MTMSSMTSSQGLGSTAFLAVGGAPRPAALHGSRSSPSSELRSRRAAGSSSGGPQVTSHDIPANWTGLTACLSLAASLAVKRKANRKSATRASVVGLKATDSDVDLVTQLQLEASKLRAEVSELEAEREEQLQRDRLSLFRSFDLDSSGAIDDQELRKGLQELGLKLDAPEATKLLRAPDKNGDGRLQLEEFHLQAASKLIEEWRAEERAAEDAQRALERQSKELVSEKQAEQEFLASLPLENDDAGLATRLASVFAYLLPLMDALRYGVPLALAFPFLQGPFSALVLLSGVFGAVPFGLGYLALLIGMQSLAQNTELPTLLRFNLRQSVNLDIALLLPGFLGSAVSFALDAAGTPVSEELAATGNSIVFVLILACVAYSTVSSLFGVAPTGLPYISQMASEAISDTRPNDEEGSGKL